MNEFDDLLARAVEQIWGAGRRTAAGVKTVFHDNYLPGHSML